MNLVAAGPHGGIDYRAADAAVFSAVVIGYDLELGDGVGRRLGNLIRIALIAGRVSIIIDAVQHEVVISAAKAVGIEGAFTGRHGVGVDGAMDVRGEQGEVGEIPAVERKLHDLLRVDHLTLFARVGFEYSGRAVYLDELIRSADLEADIDTLAGIDVDADITRSEFREAFVFDSHV